MNNLKKGSVKEIIVQLLVSMRVVKDPYDTYEEVLELVKGSLTRIQLTYLFHLGTRYSL